MNFTILLSTTSSTMKKIPISFLIRNKSTNFFVSIFICYIRLIMNLVPVISSCTIKYTHGTLNMKRLIKKTRAMANASGLIELRRMFW